jgi:iron complex transport system permease protein
MNKPRILILVLIVAVLVSLPASVGLGAFELSFIDACQIIGSKLIGVEQLDQERLTAVVWQIRLPRVLLSLMVGASLAVSGAALQGLFRNPLADPSIIGISMGAALAAAMVIVLADGVLASTYSLGGVSLLAIATFFGALLTTFLIFGIAKEGKQINVMSMLLAGIAINAIAAAGVGLLTFLADNEQLRTLTFWTLGRLGGATWLSVGVLAVATALSLSFLLPLFKSFNALSLGEREAAYMGINIEQLKLKVIIFSALSIGAGVAFCGMISFIGLVVPHIIRLLFGGDYRILLPASALGGGLLLCWADNLARTVVVPAELPIGILTALFGAPVFLYLILNRKNII